MRAFEKSAKVIVAKKPGNAGGAKDRRSRTDLMEDSSIGASRTPRTGPGGNPGPGPDGPRVEPVKPEGRSPSPVGGEDPERRDRYESLMDEVVSADNFEAALKAVQRNRGAPGVDGMKTTELKGHLQKHWPRIRAKLLDGTYAVTPVKRVEIPKPNGGVRCLGIPTVLDRFIQQLLAALDFDPGFRNTATGSDRRRSAHDAVRAAREYVVRGGRDWVFRSPSSLTRCIMIS